ncbi:hypothetical protein TWF730_006557 [Orbilia blumenaviensis]|uniref:Uncharacterized protein n=1 Tax=Orbilia blumenaviensis TaxID=1796055 RepID=A0AAV9VKW7_9PEZI
MFDINQTEIVSREDLVPPKSPEQPSQAVDWSSILGYSLEDPSPAQDDDISIASADSHPAEVAFRLFAPTKEANNVQSYILPASPPPEQQALLAASLTADIPQVSHFSEEDVQNAHATHRPTSYYLTPPLEEDEPRALRVRDAAVSGEQVLEESQQRWPGCELSWRVMKLSLTSGNTTPDVKDGKASTSTSTTTMIQAIHSTKQGRKRHRPNKKRRIILRKRRVVKEEKEAKMSKNAIKKKNKKKKVETAAAVQAVVHKRTEEEDREKKARMNRIKKMRRKNKAKEDKAEEA